jgi:hydroxypyruvate isomerase
MTQLTRRQAILTGGMAGAGMILGTRVSSRTRGESAVRKGRLKQSVSRWCYNDIPLPDFCRVVADMGLAGIDLLRDEDWPVVTDHGLLCTMGSGGGGTIAEGLNDPANHDAIVRGLTQMIPRAAKAGVPNLITFVGNRKPQIEDSAARENCVAGLSRVKAVAEAEGVTVCVELLNSKVDHAGYQGDHSAFVVDIVKAVDSPRVKALYDIYHMQIMEGDIIHTVRDNAPWIGHYHTGGVPGRHELDDTQELNYTAICRAIVDTGYEGYLAHEFVPAGPDPLASLRDAVRRCDV